MWTTPRSGGPEEAITARQASPSPQPFGPAEVLHPRTFESRGRLTRTSPASFRREMADQTANSIGAFIAALGLRGVCGFGGAGSETIYYP